jgi:glycine/D-amino acid oxidase-like deaminating enzyme
MPSVVVVGAGVFGSSVARRLALDGWEVTLVEQESPGWDGSSSSGESRLMRFSHGSHAWYARSARRARELWLEIDPSLFTECGMAWFAHGDDGWEADSERMLRAEGIAVERLEPGDAARLFPSFGGDDLSWVLFEAEGGVLWASRAVRVLAEQAREAGAQILRGRATPDGARVAIERSGSDGGCAAPSVIEADAVVWACGAWLAKLFPGLVEIRPALQEVVFLDAPAGWENAPGWVDYDASFYGHADLGGHGFKAATDAEGATADPDDHGDLDGATCVAIAAYAARRFPALATAPIRSCRPCLYELTADTHFVAAPHPEHPSVWILGGGSGHGFKHGPALAEHMAEWLSGDAPPDPRFGLGPRDTERSLRTAGVRATPLGKRWAS